MSGNFFGNDGVKRERVIFIALCIASVFVIYACYLFSMQITRWIEYRDKAWAVSRRTSEIPVYRGEIYDRNYDIPLATNVNSFEVSVITMETDREKLPEIMDRLSVILETDREKLMQKVPAADLYQPAPLKDNVSFEQISRIAMDIEDFPGIIWNSKPIRSYNHTKSLSHIIGYVGNITPEEHLVLYNKGYTASSILGKTGVEKQYDALMKGSSGLRSNTVDAKGKRIREEKEIVAPVPGKNVVLTIDRHIQELCEKALGDRMGSALVLKPATGEILAMVSYPSYDSNMLYGDKSSEYFMQLLRDSNYPFLNRPIQSTSAPASVFKTVMMTAILEEKGLDPEKKIDCKGFIELGNRTFNCHEKKGHGPVNLAEALRDSCDVYFWEVGKNYLGPEKIAEYSKKMGLGEKTGIDIPGEVAGLVPTPQWKKKHINESWVGGDTFNMSIGQGYTQVTNLQIANLIAMIVNDGTIYVPHLVKEVRDTASGTVVSETVPRILHQTEISRNTFRAVRSAMRKVVDEGTVKAVINTQVVPIAGKTGTGEVGLEDRWISWFAAYGPYGSTNPDEQVVVVVMVDATNEWEWWAPKASNAIFQGIFARQSYEEAVRALDIWYLNNGRDIIRKRNE